MRSSQTIKASRVELAQSDGLMVRCFVDDAIVVETVPHALWQVNTWHLRAEIEGEPPRLRQKGKDGQANDGDSGPPPSQQPPTAATTGRRSRQSRRQSIRAWSRPCRRGPPGCLSLMDAAGGAGAEPPAPSDHEWAHAGTDRVEMLQVHPLPLFVLPDRGGRRSRRARRHVQECNEAIQGLNWYVGYDYGLPQPYSAPNSLQRLAVARVEKLVRSQPPPSETPSEQAVFGSCCVVGASMLQAPRPD